MAHEHDRFLYEKDGALHFGCINPFCGHGNPALPNYYRIPLESDDMTIRVIAHRPEYNELSLEAELKRAGAGFEKGQKVALIARDDLEGCKEELDRVFNPGKKSLPERRLK